MREAMPSSSKNSAHIYIQHNRWLVECKSENRICCVVADSGEGDKFAVSVRYLIPVGLSEHHRGGVQPDRPPGIAEISPHPDRIRWGGPSQILGGGPGGEPFLPHGQNPGHRGLLQPEFTHQDPPGVGAAPGEVSGRPAEPVNNCSRVGRAGHRGIVSRLLFGRISLDL